jgi:hypothetical protein
MFALCDKHKLRLKNVAAFFILERDGLASLPANALLEVVKDCVYAIELGWYRVDQLLAPGHLGGGDFCIYQPNLKE